MYKKVLGIKLSEIKAYFSTAVSQMIIVEGNLI